MGFGTVAYFEFLELLILLFFVITLLALPMMWVFKEYADNNTISGWIDQFQLSALGFATVVCKDTNLAVGKLNLNCPSGIITEVVSFGLSPSDAEIMDACMPNPETDLCESLVKDEEVEKFMNSTCIG